MLHEMNVKKACGPDSLSSHVFKECATEMAPSLAHLFTRSFQSGCIPVQWKLGNVVPVHKKVISPRYLIIDQYLYYVFCQKYVYNHINDTVKPLKHPLQHGFMNGKSCTTQFLEVYENVGKCLDGGKQIEMIFLDFSKAFDSINHTMLLHKLEKIGFSGKLFNWLREYLHNRSQRVVLNGCASVIILYYVWYFYDCTFTYIFLLLL